MTEKDLIIVIGRQYGSGGRAVGRELAQRLSLPYYDKELLSSAAAECGIGRELFDCADERRPSKLRALLDAFYGSPSYGYGDSAVSPDSLYKAQSEAIRKIVSKGGCVIVGRTADYIARECPGLISVYIHADADTRAERIARRGECGCMADAFDIMRRRDKERCAYYNYYTGRQWGAADNYDLCINATDIGPSVVADIIMGYVGSIIKNRNS